MTQRPPAPDFSPSASLSVAAPDAHAAAPFAGLAPAAVWRHFATLCAIPRASKAEAPLRDLILRRVRESGLAATVDAAGNLLVRKPASPGRAGAPGVILQAHLDMVCQKNAASAHDFARDPIRPRRRDGWLVAEDTTLGADNGIGVALILAVLEDGRLEHGPLEALLTVDEEAGMGGAHGLQPGVLRGRLLLNLDTEAWGEFYIGCAGGLDVEVGRAGQLIPGPHPGGEDHHTGVDVDAVGQAHPQPGRGTIDGLDRIGADVDMHIDAEFTDHPAQQRSAGLVELLVHQPRCPLDDVGLQPELPQCIGSLQAQQTAADHHPVQAALGCGQCGGPDRVEIVEGAVHVAARQVVARHRRHECVRASGQHQRVVADGPAVGRAHRPGLPVDGGRRAGQPQLNTVVTGVIVARQRQPGPIPVLGVAGEADSVVGGVGLFGEDGHLPAARGVAGAQRLDEAVAYHAVADDHDGSWGGRSDGTCC